MERSVEAALRILRKHPGPGLSWADLHRRVSEDIPGPSIPADLLLDRIRTRPDLFRVLDPRLGAWGSGMPAGRGAPTETARLDPWILARGAPATEAPVRTVRERPDPEVAIPRLRESVLGLGRCVDSGSSTALARWSQIVREERALRARMTGHGRAS